MFRGGGMTKRKPKIIRDPKARGEWVESVFMACAKEHGLAVSKPWGDSDSFDFVVGRPGRFVSVQVKSTICQSGGGYECCLRGRRNKAYVRGSFDFLAAYVVLKDAWYIIPAGKVLGKETACLFSKSKYAKYEEYREAWHLLREASELREAAETCVEEAAVVEAVERHPTGALGRLEQAMSYFERQLERGGHPRKRSDEI
jgi:PD-(D/E)XK nuclease superfamily protein